MASVLSAGTTSNTALNLSADTTGILQFQTNGTTPAMTINTSQQVGIGTASPAQTLHVKTSTGSTPITLGVLSNATTIPALSFNGAYASTTMAGTYQTGANLYTTVPATGYHYWSVADVNKMTLDTNGNLGIGTSTPPSTANFTYLNVNATNNAYLKLSNSTTGNTVNDGFDVVLSGSDAYLIQRENAALISYTNGSERMRITSAGNVGIGTTSPAGKLHVAGSGNITQYIVSDNGATATLDLLSAGVYEWTMAADTSLRWAMDSTERMRITSGGDVLIGTTSKTYNERLSVTQNSSTADSNVAFFEHTGTNNPRGFRVSFLNAAPNNTTQHFIICGDYLANRFIVYSNGNVVNTNNSYGALSDAKLKENITETSPKLNDLMRVRVVNYNLIGETQKQIGVVAQELEQIFPKMIDESPDQDTQGNDLGTTTKSVKYSVFVPMLIKAIQELKAELDATKAEVAALKGVN